MNRTRPLRASLSWLSRKLERYPSLVDALWLGCAVAVIWMAIGLILQKDRADSLADGRTTAGNLARAFEELLVRAIREADQTMRFVRVMRDRDQAAVDLKPWLEAVDPQSRLGMQIALTDRHGIVTASTLPIEGRVDLSDRPHFRAFSDLPGSIAASDALFISAPVIGRVSRRWTLQFVRMLKNAQGEFDGIVVLSVDPGDLMRFYGSVDVGHGGMVSLIGIDGIIRARAGGAGAASLGERSTSPAVEQAMRASGGEFDWTDPADAIHRLESFRRVGGYQLLVSVGLSRAEILEGYYADLRTLLLAGAGLTALVLAVGITSRRGRQRLVLARRTLASAIEHIGQGLIMVDGEGRIALMNQRALQLLEIPRHFGPGHSFASLVAWQRQSGEFDTGTPDDVGRSIRDEPSPQLALPNQYQRTRKDGTVLEIRTEVLDNGSAVRTFTDVTAREQAQAALTAARDAAEAGMRARAQFLAVMSHEIRTPLNGILGISDLLRATALSPTQDGYARIIAESGGHLLDIVNDVLDFSRIEQSAIEIESIVFDPRAVLAGVVAMFDARARERGLRLSWLADDGVPERLTGDPHRLRQVLLNLVGNAEKFTASGGVDISMSAEPVAGRDVAGPDGVVHELLLPDEPARWRLRCSVRDTGIGMSEDTLGRLFQEFTQIDGSITRRFGGTGLGLAISRRLVEAMGGGIEVETSEGTGSVFRFDVLVSAAGDDAGDAPPELAATVPPGLRVLLAEDNRVNRLVAVGMLERLGCRVHQVEDGRAALAAVQGEGAGAPPDSILPDFILMDVMMPEMDGLAATRAIRALPGPAAWIPILGLTANAFREDERECLEAGMDGFIAKPATFDRLSAAILSILPAKATIELPDPSSSPPASSQEFPAANKTLDELVEILGADTVLEIVAAFRDDLPDRLARLEGSAQAESFEVLRREAHTLAGGAATVGLDLLAERARQVEHALRAGARTLPPGLIVELDECGRLGAKALAEWRPAAAAKVELTADGV